MKASISITAIGSISPLGISMDEAWAHYKKDGHLFRIGNFNGNGEWVAPLPEAAKKEIERLKSEDTKYQNLDDSVLYALFASRKAVQQAGWSRDQACEERNRGTHNAQDDIRFGVNIGSSRGATALFEKYHEEFLKDNRASTLSSPTTTLGNISSWVAHDLQTQGPEISHSITCSTALHSLLNGVAWIKSGMADRFLVGGSEAPLTPFTIAQMKALKIYANPDAVTERLAMEEDTIIRNPITEHSRNPAGRHIESNVTKRQPAERADSRSPVTETPSAGRAYSSNYPCQAFNLSKKRNTMILGEGASVACLEKGIPENALAVIEGIGYATEPLRHNTSISAEAECFQRSMRMALGTSKPEAVDAIVMHAPGTLKGDLSESRAIEKVFCNKLPMLTTNKWKIGHTFGTSGMLSIEMAVLMLRHQKFIGVPFVEYFSEPKSIQKILVNAVGFGGNAVSILLRSGCK